MGGLDFCGDTGVRIKESLCGKCLSCQMWAAAALTDEELTAEVERRRQEAKPRVGVARGFLRWLRQGNQIRIPARPPTAPRRPFRPAAPPGPPPHREAR